MKVLDQSLQKHKRSIQDARTVTLEFLVKECKAQMRANGERPQGGIHDVAVAQGATGIVLATRVRARATAIGTKELGNDDELDIAVLNVKNCIRDFAL